MIGRIKGDSGSAVLGDNGVWTSTDTTLAEALNIIFSTSDYSPADGEFGVAQLHAAAKAFAWKATVEKKELLPKGVVY